MRFLIRITAGKVEAHPSGFVSFTTMVFSSPSITLVGDATAKDFDAEVERLIAAEDFQAWLKGMKTEDADMKYNALSVYAVPAKGERKFPGFDKKADAMKRRLTQKELSFYAR